MKSLFTLVLSCTLSIFSLTASAQTHHEADVIVYGVTAAGVIADI